MSVLKQIHLADFKALVRSNDFDCLPRSYQVLEFTRFLVARDIDRFTASEVSDMFAVADMVSPRTTKPIRCSPAKVTEHLEKFIANGQLRVRVMSPGLYAP